ncbi:MAG TPA: NAD-dependent epimerase/dehydratase family protein [Gemmatimonadales bacterium]|nr:NAD-dependent epimerase/dehydratase family protein [Gemmatimonadales bacterium]
MSMRVLVTGANGFIGRHLVQRLSQLGYAVRAGVRGKDGAGQAGGVELIHLGEVGPHTDWKPSLEDVSVVVHLAAVAHRIGPAAAQAEEYQLVNGEGTARLAEQVAASPTVRRLILLSSIAVTGSQSQFPVSEHSVPAPDSAYGWSKYRAELAVAEVLRATVADWCALRPALVYGPGNPGNMARLFRLVSLGIPLPLDAIPNYRSFLYVENLVDVIARVLDSPQASRRVFAVADREVVSTSELLRLIGRAAGRPVRLFSVPPELLRGAARVGDWTAALLRRSVGLDSYALDRLLGSLAVDISGVCSSLDWQPPHSLETGLRQTLLRA